MTQIQKFLAAVADYRQENVWSRHGQALFNVLEEMHPELAELIRGTTLDPFYARGHDFTKLYIYLGDKLDD